MPEKNNSKTKKIKINNELSKILEKRGITPCKIFFFGSYAENNLKESSDIDVIVVSKKFRKKNTFDKARLTMGVNREMVRKIKKPFDIIYYSDIEWLRGNSLIINAVKQQAAG